jgi:hypothetical protein
VNIDQILINLDQRQNFDFAIEFVLRKIASGIRGYSIQEMQTLGKLAKLINKQDKLKFHDDKVFYLNEQIVLAFKKVLQESKSANELMNVLAYYPIPVLDGMIEAYPQSNKIVKVRDYLFLAENAGKETKDILHFQGGNVKSNKAIVAKVDRSKLSQEMEVADDLDNKIKQVGLNSLQKILDKLSVRKQELESKMEELTERLGPFISSDYSPQDIQKWLEDMSDEGLVSMEGVNVKQAVKYVQKYANLNSIEFKEEVISKKSEVVEEASNFKLDMDKEENRIQKVIQTDLKKIQKQILKVSDSVDKFKNVQEEQIPDEVVFVKEEILVEEDDMVEEIVDTPDPIKLDHYNQGDVISRLKGKHKKGMSI